MPRPSQKDKIDSAFEYYYTLGEERSYQKVAEKFGVSPNTVRNNWAVKYNWREKKLQRDIEIQRRVAEKTNDEIVEIKVGHRNDIKAAFLPVRHELKRIIDLLKQNELPDWVNDINDFERLVRCIEKLTKLNLELLGERVIEEGTRPPQVHFYIPRSNRDNDDK